MPWVFALVSAVVAALVAAAGDRMGHRAARRKLRIGKLRPRTVSTIIAVATGVLISLATYGAMFALWANFRDALTHYNRVKADLAQARAELESARSAVLQAQNARSTAEAELKVSEERVADLSGAVAEVDQQLRDTSLSLKQTDALLKKKERLQAELNRSIDVLQAEQKRLENAKEAADIIAQAKSARAGEAEVLLPRGAYLALERIPAGEAGQLRAILQRAVNRILIRFSEEGISLSPETEAAADAFLGGVGPAGEGDQVLILSVGRNLFAGESLHIAFEVRPLPALVRQGDLVMDITIGSSEARLAMAGLPETSLPLPAEESAADQYARIILGAYDRFVEGMEELGFLPQAPSGEWLTPFDALAGIGGELAARERPLKIQIVSKADADALDGLADCEIYVKSLAGAPAAGSAPDGPPPDAAAAAEEGVPPAEGPDDGR